MRVLSSSLLMILIFAVKNDCVEVVVRLIGGENEAVMVAKKNGYEYGGPVKGFANTYLFIYDDLNYLPHTKRQNINRSLCDTKILWAEEQHVKYRQKRDFIEISDIPHERVKRIFPYEELINNDNQEKLKGISVNQQEGVLFNDELWNQQWYLKYTRTTKQLPKLDLNVLKVYRSGITGKGVRISVLDDGLEYTHDDLFANYDPEISYDCNEDDYDPLPRYDMAKTNNHGTRCAGEIAMVANNKKCGIGVAFNARIGGIKVLDGLVTDRLEGTALSFGLGLIDIYSASWGPTDDGETVDGPGKLALEALERGTRMGRRGRGSIFVWASGNGGGRGDNCNCDGYLNSIYTISIGSANERGIFPWYGEACASILAVTYSSGAYRDQMIVTTDLYNNCTVRHTGTSASAPLAAGILALVLEVNPCLTWRDIQHLLVWTSDAVPLKKNPGWKKNGAGLWFSTKFGYGLLNAYHLVKRARNWITVPEKSACKVQMLRKSSILRAFEPVTISILTSACKWTSAEINYLEHVEIKTTIKYSRRGSLEIWLTSPLGTKVQLLSSRKLDVSRDGFQKWTFMSVMTWGEPPQGFWMLTVRDKNGPKDNRGYIESTQLILHGTKDIPDHMRRNRHNYNGISNRK